jgi:Kef-type K+ transport system membrane component KefB
MSGAAPAPVDSRTRLFQTLRGIAALGVVLFAVAFLHPPAEEAEEVLPGTGIFALGFLVMAGIVGGRIAATFGFPRLTGYLAVGVLSGPSGFVLFGKAEVEQLSLINGLALALIALQAGAELTLPMLKRSFKSLSWASLSHLILIVIGMMVLFTVLSPWISFARDLPLLGVLAVGAVWGSMALSKAPADILAILGETRSRGPLSTYALGIVVVLDVLVLVVFAGAMMWAKSALDPTAQLSLHELLVLGEEIGASVAAGTTFGLVIVFYLWAVDRERLLFIVVMAYGVTAFCRYFHYDTLLVFVVAGFIVQNLSREGGKLVHTTESAAAGVMVVFFATAGATLDLGALRSTWPIALALAFGRIGLTFGACQVGHALAKDPPILRKTSFTSCISQAGVTIGLATIAAEKLPGVGDGIAALVIAVIGINELIGPVAFKWGLTRAGEIGGADRPDSQGDSGDGATADAAPQDADPGGGLDAPGTSEATKDP